MNDTIVDTLRRRARYHSIPLLVGAVSLLAFGCQGQDNNTSIPLKEFSAQIRPLESSKTVPAGDSSPTQLEIKNTGNQTWPAKAIDAKGTNAVDVSYHLLDAEGKVVVFDGARTGLPGDVKPGETVKIAANLTAPNAPGKYVARFTLVQEYVSWFDAAKPSNAVDVPLTVLPK